MTFDPSLAPTVFQSIQPEITDGAYSDGDVVGGVLVVTPGHPFGTLRRVIIIEDADTTASLNPMTLYVFREQPTGIANNAAFSGVQPEDYAKLIGTIPVVADDYREVSATLHVVDIETAISYVRSREEAARLYIYPVLEGAPTNYDTDNGLTFNFTLWKS